MFVEIVGTGVSNKGAELMLAAIVERFRGYRGLELAAAPTIGPYPTRARYGLYQTFDARKAGRMGFLIERLVGAGYRKRYGLVHRKSIGAVLDASGFFLGDQWPVEWIRAKAKDFHQRKALGQTIILLPQAFGPFNKPDVAAAAREALLAADLVFARDEASLAYVAALAPDLAALEQAPDFTNLLASRSCPPLDVTEPAGAIVPNQKVLDFGPSETRNAYEDFLLRMMNILRDLGVTPFVLVHEVAADRDFAERLAARGNARCVVETDPLILKHIASRLMIMVGSRYHGLINALSQGVPAIGVSWSHKYRALFADYGRAQWLVDPTDLEQARTLARHIMSNRENEHDHLMRRGEALKLKSEGMWKRVEALLLHD